VVWLVEVDHFVETTFIAYGDRLLKQSNATPTYWITPLGESQSRHKLCIPNHPPICYSIFLIQFLELFTHVWGVKNVTTHKRSSRILVIHKCEDIEITSLPKISKMNTIVKFSFVLTFITFASIWSFIYCSLVWPKLVLVQSCQFTCLGNLLETCCNIHSKMWWMLENQLLAQVKHLWSYNSFSRKDILFQFL
jgi:hypothetical protein